MTAYFEKLGITPEQIDARIEADFNTIFFGTDEEKFYYEDGDTGYLMDTGNIDVRTEGMSYGMMISVQLDKKDIFDRIWKWVYKNLLITEGDMKGYFVWSAATDGSGNFEGSAPDGEEFFAMALLFAEKKWGNGEGALNYGEQARTLLSYMVHKGEDGKGYPMFNPENHLIKFVAEMEITDASYHLPHFYELYAKLGNPEDAEFFEIAAKNSRDYLLKAINPETGLNPEYGNYDGTPNNLRGHGSFYSDAYRTSANIGLDYLWTGRNEELRQRVEAEHKFLRPFMLENPIPVFEVDGTRITEGATEDGQDLTFVKHPLALLSGLAQGALINDNEDGRWFAQRLWDAKLRTDNMRYYDNLLYLFALMALGGKYQPIA